MRSNKWWYIPLSVIAYLAVLAVLHYVLMLAEFILFEGSWGGNNIGFFVMLFNSVFYIVSSILYAYFALPAITDKSKIGKKPAILLISVFFIIISVAACILISFDGASDIYYFFYNQISFYWAPITDVLYYTNQYVACVCVFIINAIVPISFMLGIARKNKKDKAI